jgi:hypothetical protein
MVAEVKNAATRVPSSDRLYQLNARYQHRKWDLEAYETYQEI